MTLPAPILSNVFADGELTNEVKWFTRIFSVINALIAFQPIIQADTDSVTVPSGAAATATEAIVFPNAYSAAPVVLITSASVENFSMNAHNVTATGFTARANYNPGSTLAGSHNVPYAWMAIG